MERMLHDGLRRTQLEFRTGRTRHLFPWHQTPRKRAGDHLRRGPCKQDFLSGMAGQQGLGVPFQVLQQIEAQDAGVVDPNRQAVGGLPIQSTSETCAWCRVGAVWELVARRKRGCGREKSSDGPGGHHVGVSGATQKRLAAVSTSGSISNFFDNLVTWNSSCKAGPIPASFNRP